MSFFTALNRPHIPADPQEPPRVRLPHGPQGPHRPGCTSQAHPGLSGPVTAPSASRRIRAAGRPRRPHPARRTHPCVEQPARRRPIPVRPRTPGEPMTAITVPAGSWRKGSRCHANNACVEVADVAAEDVTEEG